ncbi:unnamed protein product [Heterobilharzia americana]|nr:unnamed protein product [Heterobilharzia americana]
MHNNTHLVVYKGTVYKFKTHRPQYLEITIQSNYRNPYLTIYQKRSKWKHKFKSNSNWLVKNFRNHSNENITYNINKNTFNHTNNNNENDFIKQSTSIINQSLNGLFHVAVLHRDYKRHHHQHFQDYSGHRVWYNSQKDKKWFKSHVVQKSDSHINQSLSEHVNTSHRLIHNHLIDSSNCTNDNQIDSLSDLKSTLKSCLNISPGYKSSDKLTEKYINQMTIKKRNNNNHNSNNDRSLLIGLFMESGKVNIFEFTSISERDLCLTSLQQIISINKQTNAYPDIEFAWSVNVYFKPKDYTSAFLIPNYTFNSENLRVPKLIILYQFVRQCVSRRDGQFRIYTGRASPTGECEIVFQLTDHIEAAYAHEQCVRNKSTGVLEVSTTPGYQR